MTILHWEEFIEERKEVMLGKPGFKCTRLTVELVFKALDAGSTPDELLAEFPTLKPDHIRAAMLYAANVLTLEA